MSSAIGREQTSSALDFIYGAFFRPRETFIQQSPTLRAAVAVVLLVGMVSAFDMTGGKEGLLPIALLTALGWLIWSWLGVSAGVFLVVRAFYRRGEFHSLCAAVGLAMAPWILLGPVHVLYHFGVVGAVLATICVIGLFIWWLRLVVLAVRGAGELSARQALWALAATEIMAISLPLAWVVLMSLSFGLGIAQLI
jgi:hypothetical protein